MFSRSVSVGRSVLSSRTAAVSARSVGSVSSGASTSSSGAATASRSNRLSRTFTNGSFTPTSTVSAKKQASKLRSQEDAFEDEENDQVNEMEDDDLFGGTSTIPEDQQVASVSISSNGTKNQTSSLPPFPELLEAISVRLESMATGQASLPAPLHSFRTLLLQVRNLEDLRACVDVAKKWNSLAERRKGGNPKLKLRESTALAIQASKIGYPEVAFDAVCRRGETVLDYDVDLLRRIQLGLSRKLLKLTEDSTSREESRRILLESEKLEGNVMLTDPWQGSSQEGTSGETTEGESKEEEGQSVEGADGEVARQRAALSLIDRMLLLTSITPLCDAKKMGIDVFSLLLTMEGIVRSAHLDEGQGPTSLEPYITSEIQPRLDKTIDVLIDSNLESQDFTCLRPSQKSVLMGACGSTAAYALARFSVGKEHGGVESKLIQSAYRVMGLCDSAMEDKLVKLVEPALQNNVVLSRKSRPKLR